MKVFTSSIVTGFEEFREAAGDAVSNLGYELIRAEDFGASTSSPQRACLAGVREADITILLLGARYGAKQASGLSATHEEYREARERRRVLAFVQQEVEHEPDQAALIREARQWETGNLTFDFVTKQDLQNAVTLALHREAVSAASHYIDETELLGHAKTALAGVDATQMEPQLVLSLALGPRQEILRPSALEDELFAREIQQQTLFGSQALFAVEGGLKTNLREGWLVLSQGRASVELNSAGDIVMRQSATNRRDHLELPSLIEEDIERQLGLALGFGSALLERIDSVHRLSHVVIIAALVGLSYEPWRTREEQARSPHSGTMGGGRTCAVAYLTPGIRLRAEMAQRSHELAQDLMVLLRRQSKDDTLAR